ncbi:flagellar hook-length control protein FliK [Aminithiophilus ramosus]|uniref:Flagellar hook-length control protein FliK n=2 Tax=Synergistales TaxID=649776 RepID=A0A9Q7ALI9_9BACT|nr:flagellar hook-length control protein FliK [Aminithiophilus ramosus]QTX31663.1 flagellar hook-length control protein FliK [Aminithiophilus ramosus]QVL35470.1 flagellar hook-length control protein FliK [Synergistota bacterium]
MAEPTEVPLTAQKPVTEVSLPTAASTASSAPAAGMAPAPADGTAPTAEPSLGAASRATAEASSLSSGPAGAESPRGVLSAEIPASPSAEPVTAVPSPTVESAASVPPRSAFEFLMSNPRLSRSAGEDGSAPSLGGGRAEAETSTAEGAEAVDVSDGETFASPSASSPSRPVDLVPGGKAEKRADEAIALESVVGGAENKESSPREWAFAAADRAAEEGAPWEGAVERSRKTSADGTKAEGSPMEDLAVAASSSAGQGDTFEGEGRRGDSLAFPSSAEVIGGGTSTVREVAFASLLRDDGGEKEILRQGRVVAGGNGSSIATSASAEEPLQWLKSGAPLPEGLAEAAKRTLTLGKNRATVVVEPPALGRVEIAVRQGAQGIEATLRVDNEGLRQTIQGQLDQLRTSLQQAGITLQGLSVDVRSDGGERSLGGEGGRKTKQVLPEEEEPLEGTLDLERGLLTWMA